jgi:hypothetical protein
MISALYFLASLVTNSPATTSVSLLANAILFPLFIPSIVGASPAKPTKAFTKIS